MAQRQLLPFRMGTRRRRAKVGTIAYAASSTAQPLELPRVGMAGRLIAQFRGTSTTTVGATVFTDKGPHAFINRIRLNTNIGSASIVDLSGFGLAQIQRRLRANVAVDKAGVGDTTPSTDLYTWPTGVAANPVVVTYVIPIALNMGAQFETGLINLQAPETRVTLEVTWGALADIGTNITGLTGNLHVYYEYWEIPDPTVFALPPLTLVRTLEEQQAVGQTGDNIYTVPRQGTLLSLTHILTLNAARSDSWDGHTIKFNKTDSIYYIERQAHRFFEREADGLNPVTGVMHVDLFDAYEAVNQGDTRDAIDTEELTTLESIITVSSGATLGANNNFLASIRRIVQVLQ